MDRRELVLVMLTAANGQPYTPVQIQKAIFLISRNMPSVIDNGPGFAFEPYDYGPFDANVYSEAEALASEGEAVVARAAGGRWNTYAASDHGLERGSQILDRLPPQTSQYIRGVSEWVRKLDFSTLVRSIYDAYPDMRANSIFRG
jgi:hypothetical protein